MNRLTLSNRQSTRTVDLRLFRRIVKGLLGDSAGSGPFDLGICLMGAAEMARLNETFLRHSGATDVITFDYSEPEALDGARGAGAGTRLAEDTPRALHGEIFICVDVALVQARRFRTSWQSELVRYAVHGLLHLRGFDDMEPSARRRMKREENLLLARLSARFELRELAAKAADSGA